MINQKIYNLLFEKEDKDKDSPEKPLHLKKGQLKARQSLYSVDSQIDALILRYESASIRADDMQLNEYGFLKNSLRYLLEQEEDPLAALAGGDEGEGAGEDAGGDEGAGAGGDEDTAPTEPKGKESIEQKTPGKEEVPDLDIDEFTNRSVRLITNFKNLLRIEEAIANRIKNFLDEHYGDEFVVRYIDTLREEYGIELTEFDEEEMEQISDDVFAPGANPSATGGG